MARSRVLVVCLLMLTVSVTDLAAVLPAGASDFGQDEPVTGVNWSLRGGFPGNEAFRFDFGGRLSPDGQDDMVIGAQGWNGSTGIVYVVEGGSPTFGYNRSINAHFYYNYTGEAPGDKAGSCVAIIGDVDGNGWDEFAVTAPGWDDGNGTDRGKVYIVKGYGMGSYPNTFNLSDTSAVIASFIGEKGYDTVGGVKAAGDVNGDGHPDILVSAETKDRGTSLDVGKVYLILGNEGFDWGYNVSLAKANASWWGADDGSFAGTGLAGAGDVNGDGLDDILIGSPGHVHQSKDTGAVHVFFGKNGGWTVNTSVSRADASFIGENSGNSFGESISVDGDVNGDSIDDLIVGAGLYDTEKGRAYLFHGSVDLGEENVSAAIADTSFDNQVPNSMFGRSVRIIGDVDGDGDEEIAIGSPTMDHSGLTDTGGVYIFFGEDGGLGAVLTPGDANISFFGEHDNDHVGMGVNGHGDIDGDGYYDIVFSGAFVTNAGMVYIAKPFHNPTPTEFYDIRIFHRDHTNSDTDKVFLGRSVTVEAFASDMNGSAAGAIEAEVRSFDGGDEIKIWLKETDVDTGTYIGHLTFKDFTNRGKAFIGASRGERFEVRLVDETSLAKTINVSRAIPLNETIGPVTGQEDEQRFANKMWVLDDLNGDGIDELAVNSGDSPMDPGAGLYIYYGRSGGWDDVGLDTDADLIITDGVPGSWFGSAASSGDVNGDGHADLIVGAPTESSLQEFWRGKVYVLFGPINATGTLNASTEADASFIGDPYYGLGYRLDARGDLNGDGYEDIVMTAILVPNDFTGWTYIVFGKPDNWTLGNDIVDTYDVVYKGEGAQYYSGESIATYGDVNEDGCDDMLIAATNSSQVGGSAGKVYLVYGREKNWPTEGNLSSDADGTFQGSQAGERFGNDIAFIRSVGNDNYDDIAITSIYLGDHQGYDGNDTGALHIWKGKKAWGENISSKDADISIWGDRGSGAFIVENIGDVNGDGVNEFAHGAENYNEVYNGNGLVALFTNYWDVSGRHRNITEAEHLYAGSSWGDRAVKTIAGGGDLDGDGLDDVVVGSSRVSVDPYGNEVGAFYVVHPYHNVRPSDLTLTVYTDNEKGTVASLANHENDDLWIEVVGTDNDPARRNVAEVDIVAAYGDTGGTRLRLVETDVNTGVFENYIVTNEITNDHGHRFGVVPGDNITFRSVEEPSELQTVRIDSDPSWGPRSLTPAKEDVPYVVNFTAHGTVNVTEWTYKTYSPSMDQWATWDPVNHSLSGTPDNTHVGMAVFTLGIKDDLGNEDEESVFLNVQNRPPQILEYNATDAVEESLWELDLDCDDDGQGNMTWNMTTNATGWLAQNTTSGIINGTPDDGDLGVVYWVNVSVKDNWGGVSWTNFSINVTPFNDPPDITSRPVPEAITGVEWGYNVTVVDNDDDAFVFKLDTKPTGMNIVEDTGGITWTPQDDQVGNHTVVVNVTDGENWVLQEFEVSVSLNVGLPLVTLLNPANDRLVSITNPQLRWKGSWPGLVFDIYMGTDQAVVTSLDASVRLLSGTNVSSHTTSDLIGGTRYYWTVLPADPVNSTVGICSNGVWSFQIVPGSTENHEPVIDSTPPTDAFIDTPYEYQIVANDSDVYDLGNLIFSIAHGPGDMQINSRSGLLTWNPKLKDVGNHTVTIQVEDSKGSAVTQTWTLRVHGSANRKPHFDVIMDQEVALGNSWSYKVIAHDDDGQKLTYSLDNSTRPQGMTINPDTGLIEWTPSNVQVGKWTIIVGVTDGYLTESLSFVITVKGEGSGGTGGPTDFAGIPIPLWLAIIVGMGVAMGLVAFVAKRRKEKHLEAELAATKAAKEEAEAALPKGELVIDDLFVIYRDGRLIYHHTRRLRPDMDGDLLSGMFTAVQDFVSGSFKPESDQIKVAVNEIRYEDYRILIEHGEFLFIAVSAQGENIKPTIKLIKEAVRGIESEFGDILSDWTGETATLGGVKKYLLGVVTKEMPKPPVREEAPKKEEPPIVSAPPVESPVTVPGPEPAPKPTPMKRADPPSPQEPEEIVDAPAPKGKGRKAAVVEEKKEKTASRTGDAENDATDDIDKDLEDIMKDLDL